jgi:hypothetical protein
MFPRLNHHVRRLLARRGNPTTPADEDANATIQDTNTSEELASPYAAALARLKSSMTEEPAEGLKTKFTNDDFRTGESLISALSISHLLCHRDGIDFLALDYLDEEIGHSKNLKQIAPIRIIAVGGFVAVTHLQNRQFTGEIDFVLEPTIDNYTKIASKLNKAINTVAEERAYSPKWANDHVGVFTEGHARSRLFFASLAQDELMYEGNHLKVYAAH